MKNELELLTLRLARGAHDSPRDGLCLMEAANYVRGYEHSDQAGPCTCPVIAAASRAVNDPLTDTERQALVPYIPRILNTRGSREVELKRAYKAADLAVRVFAPHALRAAGFASVAEKLEALPEIVDRASAASAASAAWAAEDAARAAEDTAEDTASAAWATWAAVNAAWVADNAVNAAWVADNAVKAAWVADGAAWAADGAASAAVNADSAATSRPLGLRLLDELLAIKSDLIPATPCEIVERDGKLVCV